MIRCCHFRFTSGCVGCHESAVERETVARIVAWLRRHANERHGSAGQLWAADVVNRLESGDWKEGTDG